MDGPLFARPNQDERLQLKWLKVAKTQRPLPISSHLQNNAQNQ